MKITEDIYRVDNIKGANVYIVKVADGVILIDSGMPGNAPIILSFIKNLTGDYHQLHNVILTHADIDHMGSVSEIKRLTGAKVAIGNDEAAVLAGEQNGKQTKGLLGIFFKLFSLFMKVEHVRADLRLKDGDSIEDFEVIQVPGHTVGSISLFRARDGVIFSGDALLGDKEGNLKEPRTALASDPAQAAKSAAKIKALKPKLLLPGHGAPVHLDVS